MEETRISRYELDDAKARLYVRINMKVEAALGQGMEGLKGRMESRAFDKFLAGFEEGLRESEAEQQLSTRLDAELARLKEVSQVLASLSSLIA